MGNYKAIQYEIEYDYIMNNYFNSYKILSTFTKVKDGSSYKCEVLVDDEVYEFYKYDSGKIIMFPKNNKLFKGDFNNIYQFDFNKQGGINFEVIRKHNDIIEDINYDFILNSNDDKNDHVSAILNYKCINDSNNMLYKTYNENKYTCESFINKNIISSLELPNKALIAELRKYENKKVERCIHKMIHEINQCNNDLQFEIIDVNEKESLISLLENIVKEENNLKVKKR